MLTLDNPFFLSYIESDPSSLAELSLAPRPVGVRRSFPIPSGVDPLFRKEAMMESGKREANLPKTAAAAYGVDVEAYCVYADGGLIDNLFGFEPKFRRKWQGIES